MLDLFLITLQASSLQLYQKTSAQVFSSKFCETFFKQHLRAATSSFLTVFLFSFEACTHVQSFSLT